MSRMAAASLVALSACFFPADRGRLLEERVDKLAVENERLHIQLEEAKGELTKTTAGLKEALGQLDTASRTTGANIGVKLDSTIQEVAGLRGELESQAFKLKELEGKVGPGASSTASAEEPKKDEPKRPDEPRPFFAMAEEKARAGEVEPARKLYNEFLKRWPRDENAGEAHFAIGELYFKDKKCREALYEFGKVIQDHPKTRSAPQAYLHSSDCFKDLKMVPEAKLALEELQKQHPKSDAAKTAKQKLTELNKSTARRK